MHKNFAQAEKIDSHISSTADEIKEMLESLAQRALVLDSKISKKLHGLYLPLGEIKCDESPRRDYPEYFAKLRGRIEVIDEYLTHIESVIDAVEM